jgi:diacylglycerol kinase (ATP)
VFVQERPKSSGVQRLLRAFRNSWNGLKGVLRAEQAFQQELALAVVLVPLAFWLGRTKVERALLISSVLLLLLTELVNSAIETVVDRIGLERHELSGLAKDIGSSAVLLSFVNLCVVWGLIIFG